MTSVDLHEIRTCHQLTGMLAGSNPTIKLLISHERFDKGISDKETSKSRVGSVHSVEMSIMCQIHKERETFQFCLECSCKGFEYFVEKSQVIFKT